jgi:CMP/dCMP kinase
MNKRTVVISVDGPAGAGKSTVAELLAHDLGYFYFDTGVLYRAVAVRALELGVDPDDEPALDVIVRTVDIHVGPPTVDDGRQVDVFVEGNDVSHAIRTPEVDRIVSRVAATPAVRRGLIDLQRRQVQGAGTIMAGRDIGTVVCPDADLKVFLTAGARERAARRQAQIGAPDSEFDSILHAIEERDRQDTSRSTSPLVVAEDAVVVDTDGHSIAAVVERIKALLVERVTERACMDGEAGTAEAGR